MAPFRRKQKDKEKTIESTEPHTGKDQGEPHTYVRFMALTGLMDVTPISDEVRKGNMVVMDVGPLVEQGSELKLQLKRAVDQLRAVCFSVDGDIGQLGNRYILLLPKSVKIFREPPPEETEDKP